MNVRHVCVASFVLGATAFALQSCDSDSCYEPSDRPMCEDDILKVCQPDNHWRSTDCASKGTVCGLAPGAAEGATPSCHLGKSDSFVDDLDYERAQFPMPPDEPTDYQLFEDRFVDHVTGLTWEREAREVSSFAEADEHCRGLNLGGSGANWRVPTAIEAQTLVGQKVVPTPQDSLLTASPLLFMADPTPWLVSASSGAMQKGPAAGTSLRCVLRQPIEDRSRLFPSEMVDDSRTRLYWQGLAPDLMLTFAEAEAYCQNLVIVVYDDWRLPTGKELVSVLDVLNYSPHIDVDALRGPLDRFWTSSPVPEPADGVLAVHVGAGTAKGAARAEKLRVRCVRPIPSN